MSDNAIIVQSPKQLQSVVPLPMELWRDPQTVSPEDLAAYIQVLEKACLENPKSADVRTCLGMAYAMNYEVYKSMDALEAAIQLEPEHFYAQLKHGELLYRLRALARAEEESLKAVHLARNPMELSISRKQLQEIRRLRRESIRDIAWTKPLRVPVFVLAGMMLATVALMYWK